MPPQISARYAAIGSPPVSKTMTAPQEGDNERIGKTSGLSRRPSHATKDGSFRWRLGASGRWTGMGLFTALRG